MDRERILNYNQNEQSRQHSLEEAADHLGMSAQDVRDWIDQGKLKAEEVDNRFVVYLESVDNSAAGRERFVEQGMAQLAELNQAAKDLTEALGLPEEETSKVFDVLFNRENISDADLTLEEEIAIISVAMAEEFGDDHGGRGQPTDNS